MIEQVVQSLRDTLAVKGVRRALWLALVVTAGFVFLEAHTQYFSSSAMSSRLSLIEQADRPGISTESTLRLSEMRNQIVADIAAAEARRKDPFGAISTSLVRFLKGAYIVLPLIWITVKLTFRFSFKIEDRLRPAALHLGLLATSSLLWCSTVLGLVSVVWNTSSSLLISWIVFPLTSAFVLMLIAGWIAILRAFLPSGDNAK